MKRLKSSRGPLRFIARLANAIMTIFVTSIAVTSSNLLAQHRSDTALIYGYNRDHALTLGRNFDPSEISVAKTQCLIYDTIEQSLPETATSSRIEFTYVETNEQLRMALGVDVSAEASYFGFGGGGSMMSQTQINRRSNSLTLVLRANSEYLRRFATNPQLTPQAESWIEQNQYDTFIENCGSHYITSERRGSTVAVIINIDNASSELQQTIRTTARASGAFGPLSGRASASLNLEFSRSNASRSIGIRAFTTGGRGIQDLGGLLTDIFSNDNPIRVITNHIATLMSQMTAANAAPIGYSAAPNPFLPINQLLPGHYNERTRRLVQMVDRFYEVSADMATIRNIGNESSGYFRFIAPIDARRAASELPLWESYIETLRQAHERCVASSTKSIDDCQLPTFERPQFSALVLNIVSMIEELDQLDGNSSKGSTDKGGTLETTAKQMPPGSRLYRAVGEHVCWSNDAVGHRCIVDDVGFSSCNEAFFTLKNRDCCPRTDFGGSSVDFKITTCTWWH